MNENTQGRQENLAVKVAPEKLYPVRYIYNQDRTREDVLTFLPGKDLTENQIREWLHFASPAAPAYPRWVKASAEPHLAKDQSAIIRWYHHGEFLRIDLMNGHYLYDWAEKNNMDLDRIEYLLESPSPEVNVAKKIKDIARCAFNSANTIEGSGGFKEWWAEELRMNLWLKSLNKGGGE